MIYFIVFIEYFMMTSSNGNIFRVTGPLFGKFTGPFAYIRDFMLVLVL